MPVEGVESWAAITATVLFTLVALFGNLGNILFFVVFKNSHRLQTWQNTFHISITAINIVGLDIIGPAYMAIIWLTDTSSTIYKIACQIFPTFLVVMNCVLLSHVAIAVLRCLKVSRPHYALGKRSAILALLASLLVPAGMQVQMILTKTGIIYDNQCGYAARMADSHVLYSFTLIIVISFAILSISYMIVFIKFRQRQQQVGPLGPQAAEAGTSRMEPLHENIEISPETPSGGSKQIEKDEEGNGCTDKGNQEEDRIEGQATVAAANHTGYDVETIRRVTCTNLIQLASFVATYGVALVTINVGSRFNLNTSHYTICFSFILVSFSLNPLIYILRNKEFHSYLDNFWRRVRLD